VTSSHKWPPPSVWPSEGSTEHTCSCAGFLTRGARAPPRPSPSVPPGSRRPSPWTPVGPVR
jgi:hypothetical protein